MVLLFSLVAILLMGIDLWLIWAILVFSSICVAKISPNLKQIFKLHGWKVVAKLNTSNFQKKSIMLRYEKVKHKQNRQFEQKWI